MEQNKSMDLDEYFNKNNKKQYMKGQTNAANAIAYCHNNKHKGYLNKKLMKQHDCLGKNCRYLEKYETKRYWIEKSVINVLKKYNKNNGGSILIDGKNYYRYDVNDLVSIAMQLIKNNNTVPTIEYVKDNKDVIIDKDNENTNDMSAVTLGDFLKDFGTIVAMQVIGEGQKRLAIKDIKNVVLNHKSNFKEAYMLLINEQFVFRVVINGYKDDFVVYKSELGTCFDENGHQVVEDEELYELEEVF